MKGAENPFEVSPPKEIPLPNAPLVRVIAQVRFPLIISIGSREFVAPFQEQIRSQYPVLREEEIRGTVVGPMGMGQGPVEKIWRFCDVAGDWRASLGSGFLALETTKYGSRSDFLGRLEAVLSAFGSLAKPVVYDRLGIRYIDRIDGKAVDDISKLIRSEVSGISGSSAAKNARHTLSEALFAAPAEAADFLARWGHLPPNAMVDPAAIEPIAERSWLLDLDMFRAGQQPFKVDALVLDAKRFAERIYTFFRWAVTADFLRRYGGTV